MSFGAGAGADVGADTDALQAFADGALGGNLPADLREQIARAGQLRERPAEAQALLEQARDAAPGHPAPLIALYRFHFYGHRLAEARAVGEVALAAAGRVLGTRFEQAVPSREEARHDVAVRFYLFTLKGLAYLSLRLGEPARARVALEELRRLDPEDHVGGALLQHVLQRHEAGGDPDAEERLQAHPARGWPARREEVAA